MLPVLTTQVGGKTPPLNLGSPHQFHDRVPDRRRQAVPGRDKLAEGRIVPTQFRQAQGAIDASGLRIKT